MKKFLSPNYEPSAPLDQAVVTKRYPPQIEIRNVTTWFTNFRSLEVGPVFFFCFPLVIGKSGRTEIYTLGNAAGNNFRSVSVRMQLALSG